MKHTISPLCFLVAAGFLVSGAFTIAIANDTTVANRTVDIADTNQVRVAAFSSLRSGDDLPLEWEPLRVARIPRHTEYTLASVDGITVLRAEADAAMSGVARKVDIDPNTTPWLHWRWRIAGLNEKSALYTRQGDDFPARIYVFFDFDIMRLSLLERITIRIARALHGESLPLAALCYVWSNDDPPGTTAPNAYTKRVQMVVASSGAGQVGQWIAVERNVRDDFRNAFGAPVPRITGIAIATDSDDTGESSVAWYGDISFSAQAHK
jgi:hypothetical protein